MIQVESEDDVFSSIHEMVHIDEQTSTVNDLVRPLAKEITDPDKFEIESSFIDAPQPVQDYDKFFFIQSDDSFHDQDDETLQQVLDRIYEEKIAQLKEELKEFQVNATTKDERIKCSIQIC